MVKVISFLGSSTVKWLKWENLKHQHGLLEIVGYPPLSSSSLPAVNAGVCVFNTLIYQQVDITPFHCCLVSDWELGICTAFRARRADQASMAILDH